MAVRKAKREDRPGKRGKRFSPISIRDERARRRHVLGEEKSHGRRTASRGPSAEVFQLTSKKERDPWLGICLGSKFSIVYHPSAKRIMR